MKFRRENSHNVLARNNQKVGIKDYGDSRHFCSSIRSVNGKSGHNVFFDVMPADYKEVCVERRSTFYVACAEED